MFSQRFYVSAVVRTCFNHNHNPGCLAVGFVWPRSYESTIVWSATVVLHCSLYYHWPRWILRNSKMSRTIVANVAVQMMLPRSYHSCRYFASCRLMALAQLLAITMPTERMAGCQNSSCCRSKALTRISINIQISLKCQSSLLKDSESHSNCSKRRNRVFLRCHSYYHNDIYNYAYRTDDIEFDNNNWPGNKRPK